MSQVTEDTMPLLPGAERYQLDPLCWMELSALPAELSLPKKEYVEFFGTHPDERGTVMMMGVETKTKRWFESYGRDYEFSGILHEAGAMPELVSRYMDWVNATPYSKEGPGLFNGCLVNWYGDGHDRIGSHADDTRGLVPDTPIVCISFGAERKFRVRRPNLADSGPLAPIVLDLLVGDGTVYVMGGKMQEVIRLGREKRPRYKHESPPIGGESGNGVGSRVSLTFRKFQ